jgi:hypothetical protein
MTGYSLKFATFSITACLCVLTVSPIAAAQKGGVRKPKKKAPQQEKQAPQLPTYTPAPLQPLPLEQVPAVAPKVHFSDGQLTIVAHNSTLSDVLNEVREQTGAELDIPPNANERVVADLGPGPARSVLADLLNGTHFNYVMVGSITDPKAIQSIVLTARTGGPDTTTTASNGGPQRGGFPQPAMPAVDVNAATENDGAEEADQGDEQPEQADQSQPNNGQPTTPKTPEQLLQELQRQQQQMQQQQNQPGQTGQPGQNAQTPAGVLPNQPPTGAAPTPTKPE